jgi:excisionase family DNA binding protein
MMRRAEDPEYRSHLVAATLNVKQLAERLGVSRDTVYRHADEWGVLRVGGVLRFDWEAVQARLRTPPPAPLPEPPLNHGGRPRRTTPVELLPIRGKVVE